MPNQGTYYIIIIHCAVREKRVGILKPQGSLERAREERALANNNQEEQVRIS